MTSESQKKANLKWKQNNHDKVLKISRKWRETNREIFNKNQRELSLNYWKNNKDAVLEKKQLYYQYKKECLRMNNILLNPSLEITEENRLV